jgi:hypothetical protein
VHNERKIQMHGRDANMYRNALDCFVTLFESEGLIGAYKGVVPRLGRVVPEQESGSSVTHFSPSYIYI